MHCSREVEEDELSCSSFFTIPDNNISSPNSSPTGPHPSTPLFSTPRKQEETPLSRTSLTTSSSVRKTKGRSAIVLTYAALQRLCTTASPFVDDDQADDKFELEKRSWALSVLQRTWRRQGRRLGEWKRIGALCTIQRWLRSQQRMRTSRFTQHGRWTIRQANLVWAILLGHRVRLLLRCGSCRRTIDGVRDTLRVLHDIWYPTPQARPLSATIDGVVELGRGVSLDARGVAPADRGLVNTLLLQLKASKARLQQSVFGSAIWVKFPSPGYVDLSRSLLLALTLDSVAKVRSSPARQQQQDLTTPPRSAFQPRVIGSSNDGGKEARKEGAGSAVLARALRFPSSIPPAATAVPTTTAPYATTKSDRNGRKHAHIQLDLLGCDKLCPAQRKSGTEVADRKPCLRVTLLLRGAGGSNALAPVKKISRDFYVATLSPRWACTIQMPLPCPKRLLPSLQTYQPDAADDDILDRSAYSALLDWWAGGVIKVEVLDGERFNTDIFLGECTIYISQFNLGNVGGALALEKQSATDRVTGTITLAAYLHLPTISALRELHSTNGGERSFASLSDASPGEEREGRKIAQSVRTSQSRFQKASSPVTTDSPAMGEAPPMLRDLHLPDGRNERDPHLPPPYLINVDPNTERRRSQIASCLDGLDAVQASTDALLGQINSKLLQRKVGIVQSGATATEAAAGGDEIVTLI